MESAGLLACLIVRCCMVLFLFLFLACTCCFVLLLRVSASSESCPQPPPPLTWRSRHVVSVKAFAIFPLTPLCATTTSTHVIKGRRLVLLAAGPTEDAKGELLFYPRSFSPAPLRHFQPAWPTLQLYNKSSSIPHYSYYYSYYSFYSCYSSYCYSYYLLLLLLLFTSSRLPQVLNP